MSQDTEKSEEPTEKRLREAHADGHFARSAEVNVVFVLAAAYCVILFTLREQAWRIGQIGVEIFAHLGRYELHAGAIEGWSKLAVVKALQLVLPVGAMCALAGVLAGGLQSRFQFTPKVLEIKFSRLDPVAGFQRVFSSQGWMKLGSEALKFIIVAFLVLGAVKGILSDSLFYMPVSMPRLATFLQEAVTTLLGRFILVFGAIAAVNYLYQLRKVNKDLKMSKQEVREEMRSSEGDPHVRGARRQMARRLLQKQMLGAVPNADVVVTNPTHYAVALRYERGKDKAPVVLAKGVQLFAQRIKKIAGEHGVPMVENRPVAQMLFKYGKVGKPIPVTLYQGVADILAFVYKTHRYYFHSLRQRRALGEAAGISSRRSQSVD
jgi:flagellar biosynthetic protein FlhB